MPITQIPKHCILDGSIGTSAHSAHKAILTKILISTREESSSNFNVSKKWRSVSSRNRDKFHTNLELELNKLSALDLNYKQLRAALNRAKTNSLGRVRPLPANACNTTPQVDRLDIALGKALFQHNLNPSLINLRKAMSLEKELSEARTKHQTESLLRFLDEIESLHQVCKMRRFYQEVKKKTIEPKDPSFVIWDPDSPSKKPKFSSTKSEYFANWARYLEKTFADSTTLL